MRPSPGSIEFERPIDRTPAAPSDVLEWRGSQPSCRRLAGRQAAVRMPPGEELIGHEAERVHVVRRMRLPALRHLAGRVAWRQRREPSRVERIRRPVGFARKPRDAEVEDLRGAFAGGERVTRLEIAVHDAARVGVGEPGGEPADDPACALRRDATRLGPDQCVERHPVEQLHGDKRLASVRIHVERVDRGDVGMCERARLAGFALQRDVGILVTLHVAAQELDRHMWARIPCLLEQQVLCLPYLAHGAGAQQLFEAIAAPDQVAGAGRDWGGSR